MDSFTQKRLLKFVESFRERSGTFPSLRDLEQEGFAKQTVEQAVRQGILEMFYVTLTSGSVVKTYRLT